MKQILLINDVVGCSHVGMVAMFPILTHLGHSTYNLPTALVSNTLDYGHFNVLETTDYMRGAIPVWRKLGFRFDAVCTGLMFSEEQATLVASYCRQLQSEGTTVFVDPIMGDGGRLYNGISDTQVRLMKERAPRRLSSPAPASTGTAASSAAAATGPSKGSASAVPKDLISVSTMRKSPWPSTARATSSRPCSSAT